MIDERQEELAALYALDLLEGGERAQFERDALYPLAGIDTARAAEYAQVYGMTADERHLFARSVWVADAFLLVVVSIHESASAARKIWSHAALATWPCWRSLSKMSTLTCSVSRSSCSPQSTSPRTPMCDSLANPDLSARGVRNRRLKQTERKI